MKGPTKIELIDRNEALDENFCLRLVLERGLKPVETIKVDSLYIPEGNAVTIEVYEPARASGAIVWVRESIQGETFPFLAAMTSWRFTKRFKDRDPYWDAACRRIAQIEIDAVKAKYGKAG